MKTYSEEMQDSIEPITHTTKEELQTNKEKHMILTALEFFVDYKFMTGKWMQLEYIKAMDLSIPKNNKDTSIK